MDITSEKTAKSLFNKVLPVQIISYGVIFLHTLTDSIIVGNFMGTDSLAVISYAVPVSLIVSMLGGVVSTGCQILCGESLGKGDIAKTNKIFSVGLMTILIFGLITFAAGFLFSEKAALLLGAKNEVAFEVSRFIKGISIGFFFLEAYKFMIPFMQLENSNFFAGLTTVVMLISKAAFDIISVFVLNGGVFGIALSTSLAYAVSFVLGTGYYFSKKCNLKFTLEDAKFSDVFTVIKVGSPNAMLDTTLAVRTALFNTAAEKVGGVAAVSAYSIASNVSEMLFAGINGIGGTALLLSSIYFGKKDEDCFRYLYKRCIIFGMAISYSVFAFTLVFATPLAQAFGAKEDVLRMTSVAIKLFMAASLVNFIPIVTINFFKGMKKQMRVNIMYLFQFLILPLVILNTLPHLFGINAIWLDYLICDFAMLAATFATFIKFVRKKS